MNTRSLGVDGDMIFTSATPSTASIVIDSLPASIIAAHASADISLAMNLELKRDAPQHAELLLYSGHQLACTSPSQGILLYGESVHGATLNLQSALLSLDTSAPGVCRIDTDRLGGNASSADVIWLHPTCEDAATPCVMHLGGATDNVDASYTLTDSELEHINTSATATIFLGDSSLALSHDIDAISVYDISSLTGDVGREVNIIANSLSTAGGHQGDIRFAASTSAVFTLADVNIAATRHITLEHAASLRLDATASHTLRLHANSDCTYPHTVAGSATLTLRNESRLVSTGDAAIVYYGGDLDVRETATVNSSQAALTISERCTAPTTARTR